MTEDHLIHLKTTLNLLDNVKGALEMLSKSSRYKSKRIDSIAKQTDIAERNFELFTRNKELQIENIILEIKDYINA